MADEDSKQKVLVNLTLFSIVITLIFIMFISMSAVNIENERACGTNRYSSVKRNLVNTTPILNNNDLSVLKFYEVSEVNNVAYDFCYDVIINSNSGLQISIVNKDDETLGIDFLNNITSRYCTELDTTFVERKNYLGLRCDTCNNSHNITLRETVIGNDVIRVIKESGNITVLSDNSLSFELVGRESCKGLIRFYAISYFILVIGALLMAGIFVGYDFIRKSLIEDIMKRFGGKKES